MYWCNISNCSQFVYSVPAIELYDYTRCLHNMMNASKQAVDIG